MAAITPSTLFNVSMGSLTGKIARFVTTSVDSGDSWSSGITDIVAIFPTKKEDGSNSSTTGIAVSFTATSGTIFMYPASENSTVDLLVLHGEGYTD